MSDNRLSRAKVINFKPSFLKFLCTFWVTVSIWVFFIQWFTFFLCISSIFFSFYISMDYLHLIFIESRAGSSQVTIYFIFVYTTDENIFFGHFFHNTLTNIVYLKYTFLFDAHHLFFGLSLPKKSKFTWHRNHLYVYNIAADSRH